MSSLPVAPVNYISNISITSSDDSSQEEERGWVFEPYSNNKHDILLKNQKIHHQKKKHVYFKTTTK